ncbi:LCP family protein [Georgenia halophila]|uniref:LCP family protein n=1 Tax=Georgenia halophila TaxID=620889 RepID=UPI0031E82C89
MGLVVLALALAVPTAVVAQLRNQVTELDVEALVDPPPTVEEETSTGTEDPNAGEPVNILLIGSDARSADGINDSVPTVLADTHIVVHVSADRSRVELVSIPRDTMVQIPECTTTSGATIPARFDMYNSAFSYGWKTGQDRESAVACDLNLAQSTTGLSFDGFVLVEMGGFIDMVDAMGGIDICIPEPIDVPKAQLVLDAGQQTLGGRDALGYARVRVGIGNGTDPERIERQQHLMSAFIDDALSHNILLDAPELYGMAEAALRALSVSPSLNSLRELAGLGLSLQGLRSSDVTFVTTPTEAYPPDTNRLQWTVETREIWERLREDEPLAGEPEDETSSEEATGDPADETESPVEEESAETEPPGGDGGFGSSAEELDTAC